MRRVGKETNPAKGKVLRGAMIPGRRDGLLLERGSCSVPSHLCSEPLLAEGGQWLERAVPQPASSHLKRELPLVNQPW